MAHIHTGPGEHDSTASAYIVRTDGIEPVLLLHMHKKLPQYLQFGGHVELHENPWDAITHEIAEESGYRIGQLQLLQPALRIRKLSNVLVHPVPVSFLTHEFEGLNHNHTDMAFAFTVAEDPADSIAEGESAIMKSFTVAELKALSQKDIPDNVREIGIFILEEILGQWESIPSPTAA